MKLISYLDIKQDCDQLAIYDGNKFAYNLNELDKKLPDNMQDFLLAEEDTMILAKQYDAKIKKGEKVKASPLVYSELMLLSPVVNPSSLRDAYAFKKHVETARLNRGLDMIPEYDQFPVFYFSNHHAIYGEGIIECMPLHLNQLDFELEVAIVIGKEGRNIHPKNADEYIAGFMIMNDISARHLQMMEMKLNLGPAKGKDFATVLGPWLVTPDELAPYKVSTPKGHIGNTYDLCMQAYINNVLVSDGNLKDMHFTFAEIIARASYGVDLIPGDVIGSGTVGGGCLLEINGTKKRENANYVEQWLKPNDQIILKVSNLGELNTSIALSEETVEYIEPEEDI